MGIKKPAGAGSFRLQRRGALLAFLRVRLRRNDVPRFDYHPRDGLVRGESAAAVNVLALMIAFLGRFAQVAAGASMGHVTAEWTVHHKNPLEQSK